jgi:heavy metal sensor kinase
VSTAEAPAKSSVKSRRFGSLRTRITLWYGGILALCLLVFSLAVGTSFTSHVRAEMDRRVHEDIELAARALLVNQTGRPSWAGGFLGKQVHEEEGGGHWIEIWSTLGERLLAAGTATEPMRLGRPAASDHKPKTVILPAGRMRVLTETVHASGHRFLVRAVVSEVSAQNQVRSLWLQLGALSLTVLTLGGLGGYALAQRSLGPLARMAEHARRITAEQLSERLSPEDSGMELNQLRDAFNDTLARLERSFAHLRRFTADASHELRTPLTALRSVGEVGLHGSRTIEDYREVIGTMLEEADRLSRLADDLLTLARAETGQTQLRFEPLDLSSLAREVCERLSVLAEERGQTLETRAHSPLIVCGDRPALRQALLNLVDNAIKYSPERSQVIVQVGSGPAGEWVEVKDEGPGIPAEDRERIFERFYRIDSSRSRGMGGTGLGLSLVKSIAEAHAGRVELETEKGAGSVFRLVLPRS